ncbi:MAG: N-acetyltransferase [Candidatus Aenigmarchaeota archaeon]|nr:N-acetyltransferase [Candidatus Aenigmarchaeota archaeon]
MQINHLDGKFFVVIEGKESILNYRLNGNKIDIYHVFVPEDLRGRGIAEQLALAAFSYARRNKLSVIPTCPYIRDKFLEEHKEFLGIVEKK